MDLLQRLTTLVDNLPDHPLFEEEQRRYTVAEWFYKTQQLASRLMETGVIPGDRVIVSLERGIDAAMAIYAILWCGASYVPIDAAGPANRSRQILNDVGSRLVVGKGQCPEWASGAGYFDIMVPAAPIAALEHPCEIEPEQIAAILYTSGSTGTPKGVTLSHRAIMAFVDWGHRVFQLNQHSRIASLAPFYFDLSLFDLFTAPCAGGTTCFMPDRLKLAPAKLADWLGQQSISCWYTVPSILGFLALKGGLRERALPKLKQILFAGEVFPTARLKSLTQQLPDVSFYNLFGPTETNVCLYWPIERALLENAKPIPIGKSACHASLRITESDSELLVKGPCLMSGYWQQSGKPMLPLDSDGWFHTGDKVSLNSDGNYRFHGRLDRMIKSAGYRVEPAEIEQLLNDIDSVDAAAVLSIPDPISGSRIAAAVAGRNNSQQMLRQYINKRLPAYMRPAYFLLLESMPVLSCGKTDYQAVGRMIEKEFK
ncbi:MAG: AMP-binding protein [Candidatus Thiodiazotropha sp. (ex Lucinoma kastoroae)]|nr:AMP-binding protein [Candidatus Thiodiazotropha sp. (ex Lucinoma kastoroae)]